MGQSEQDDEIVIQVLQRQGNIDIACPINDGIIKVLFLFYQTASLLHVLRNKLNGSNFINHVLTLVVMTPIGVSKNLYSIIP